MSVDCARWTQVKQRLGVLPLATVTYSELHAAALHAAVIAGRNTTGALAMVVRIGNPSSFAKISYEDRSFAKTGSGTADSSCSSRTEHETESSRLKMQGGTVSYEAIATSLLYAQNSEWMWIFNVLAHYDLPDLSAAAGEHLTKTTLV